MKYSVSDGVTTGEHEAGTFDDLASKLYDQCGDLNGDITVFIATAEDGETMRWIWWEADSDILNAEIAATVPDRVVEAWRAQCP